MEHAEKMPLKAFWESVERRLAASSADELRAILRAVAHETPPGGRRAFLARLGPVEEADVALSQAAQPGDLLADIDDLAHELEDTMQHADAWEDRYDGDDYYDEEEEDSLGPYEEFVEPLAGLLAGPKPLSTTETWAWRALPTRNCSMCWSWKMITGGG